MKWAAQVMMSVRSLKLVEIELVSIHVLTIALVHQLPSAHQTTTRHLVLVLLGWREILTAVVCQVRQLSYYGRLIVGSRILYLL